MLKIRVIPSLLLENRGLVKTVAFRKPRYVGDPINAVKIFNEKEVDELVFLDISATAEGKGPNYDLIRDIATECFMPFGYGGNIRTIEQISRLFQLGVEKVIISSHACEEPGFIREAAHRFGSQSIIVSIDVKKTLLGKYSVYARGGRENTGKGPVEFARMMEQMGAGEIILTFIDRDGKMTGYDIPLIRMVSRQLSIPLIARGGAGKIEDFADACAAGASAVTAGSLFVFYGKHRAVLINYPEIPVLEKVFQDLHPGGV
jgi:imidazole glycerol-phosphate synthase subunit HisF